MNFPKNVLWFEVLLYLSLTLDALSVAFQDRTPTADMTDAMILASTVMAAGLILLLVYFVWLAAQRRKNWPRWALVAALVLSVISLAQVIGDNGIELDSAHRDRVLRADRGRAVFLLHRRRQGLVQRVSRIGERLALDASLELDRDALKLVSERRPLRIHVETIGGTDFVGLERKTSESDAFVAGRDIAELPDAFEEEVVGRVRRDRHGDFNRCIAVAIPIERHGAARRVCRNSGVRAVRLILPDEIDLSPSVAVCARDAISETNRIDAAATVTARVVDLRDDIACPPTVVGRRPAGNY